MKSPKPAAGITMKNKIATFDGLKSLPVSVAIVEAAGTIVAVNRTWEQFGRRNGLRLPRSAVGLNYLDYCLTGEPNSRQFVTQLKALLAGRRDLLTFIYPCHSPMQARWFCLIGLPLSLSESGGVALLHMNLTKMLPLRIGARRARAKGKQAQVRQQTSSSAIGGILERSVLEPLSSQLNEMLAGLVIDENNGSDLMKAARTRLSKRQMEVLKLLGQGKSNKEIAVALLRSPNTIKLHVSAILERLKLKSRVEAALLSSKLLQNDPDIDAKARVALRLDRDEV
jgi:DNA-binding CsgD family transcriptional regulator